MSGDLNNSTTTPTTTTPTTTTTTLLSTNCGAKNCDNNQECFAATEGLICDNSSNSITSTSYSWKLNSTVFPPLQYIGTKIGRKVKDNCEIFKNDLWSEGDKTWLLTFFYQNWKSNDNNNNNNNGTSLPPGSFARPLDYIGSCTNVRDSLDKFQNIIHLQQLYCDYDNKCKKKIVNINSQDLTCNSSNQCLSQLCGNSLALSPIYGDIPSNGGFCQNDDFISYNQLKGNRSFNVIPKDGNNNNDNNKSNSSDGDNNGDNKDSSGSMAIVIIIIVILFASMAIYGYARRMFKKRDNEDDDTRYLRREIDPETGEIVTVNTLGGRVRRGASLLLNRSGLNRTNSIRTLPPYTVMDEDYHPETNNISGGSGIISSIVNSFFPPGELPPPYDSIAEDNNNNNNNNNNNISNVILNEVRDDDVVIIEVNNNNNDNNNIISPSRSRRSSLIESNRDRDDGSPPRELGTTTSEVSSGSEGDNGGEQQLEEQLEEEKEEEKEGEEKDVEKEEVEKDVEKDVEKEKESEKESEVSEVDTNILSDPT